MGFLWPSAPDPYPSFPARLGRILHWIALAFAALWVLCGVVVLFSDSDGPGFTAICFGIALAIAVAGRGARYLFGNE